MGTTQESKVEIQVFSTAPENFTSSFSSSRAIEGSTRTASTCLRPSGSGSFKVARMTFSPTSTSVIFFSFSSCVNSLKGMTSVEVYADQSCWKIRIAMKASRK